MMEKIKVLCFDYYRTIVELDNPFNQIKNWLTKFLNNTYPDIDPDMFYSRFTRNRAFLSAKSEFQLGIDLLTNSVEKTCAYFHVPSFKDKFGAAVEELFIAPRPYSDAHFVLAELKKYYQVGLLTNADNYILQASLLKNQFTFDFVFTSNDVQCYKPDKFIFQYALSELKIGAVEMFMIGDSQVDDIYGAGQLGINTIWVNRSGELLKDGIIPPNYQVDSLEKVMEIFTSKGV